ALRLPPHSTWLRPSFLIAPFLILFLPKKSLLEVKRLSPMHQAKSDETIFSEALNLPPEQRGSYLEQATNGDQTLRQRIESLLSGYEAVDFLEHSAAPELQLAAPGSVPLTEAPGDKIGRYKLLQQI